MTKRELKKRQDVRDRDEDIGRWIKRRNKVRIEERKGEGKKEDAECTVRRSEDEREPMRGRGRQWEWVGRGVRGETWNLMEHCGKFKLCWGNFC